LPLDWIDMPLIRTTGSDDIRDLPPMNVIFGQSPMMAAARVKLERTAETLVPVLLQGENGTGKDIFARLLHARSNRSKYPLVKVACPAIPHSLIESELFGYEKGAFTGAYATKRGRVELAHLGTLFLDEVGSLDISAQAKLLQLLQDGTFMRVGAQESRRVDVRLICAANENLRQQTEDGSFRLDFFFRINAVTIELPSLRQRAADIPALIDYFSRSPLQGISSQSEAAFARNDPHDAAVQLARKHPPTREHGSQLCFDWQRGGPGGGLDSVCLGQPDPRD